MPAWLITNKKKKSNLHYTRGITPKRVTSGGIHLHGLAPGSMFRNGCIENFHFALRRCDWLEQLREYAASNEMFCSFYYHHSTHVKELRVKETSSFRIN